MNVREEAIDKQRLRCQTLRFFRSSQGFGKAVLIQKCASEFVMAKPGDQELIVVAIILIIAAIAIPNLMRSSEPNRQQKPRSQLFSINTATATYSSNWRYWLRSRLDITWVQHGRRLHGNFDQCLLDR